MKQQKILLLGALGFAGYKLFIEDDKQKIVYDSTNPPIDTKIGKRKKNNGLDLSSVNPELPNVSGTQTVGVGSDQFELSLIPIETEPNHFSPQLFPVTMYGTIFHSELGFELPKLIFSLQTSFSKIYEDLAVDYTKRGIWESTDYHLHKTEGMEWNLFEDEFYQNDISKRTGINRNTWIDRKSVV